MSKVADEVWHANRNTGILEKCKRGEKCINRHYDFLYREFDTLGEYKHFKASFTNNRLTVSFEKEDC